MSEIGDEFLDAHLDRIERAGRIVEDRLDKHSNRSFLTADQHLNGVIATFLERVEVMRKIPFRSAKG